MVLVYVVVEATGSRHAEPIMSVLGIFSAFLITGIIVGLSSKGVTILEPGLASIVVSTLIFYFSPWINAQSLLTVSDGDWLLILLNSVILTFIGAWLGEKLQNAISGKEDIIETEMDWGWTLGGTVLGVTASLILVNIFGFVENLEEITFFIPFAFTLLITGIVIGWMSKGVTITEAGFAGFLTITIDLTIIRLALVDLEVKHILLSLVLGFIITYIGGYIGEKIQSAKQTIKNEN